ncbi:hypothetical protein CYMTET_12651 [Cymbomonas tetramitiformis]|uniref:Uncharacterized protein n=1 Tax=Cymbomonas tetramitiformis TaxID=36881 RepID=A0AAE0LC81_9CHLO|nr:hypothetical protein CYMTET_12651 [Cymbomonas tetramitiformis]
MNFVWDIQGAVVRLFQKERMDRGKEAEKVKLSDVAFLSKELTKQGEKYEGILGALAKRFTNPPGGSPFFPEEVCVTTNVTYTDPKGKLARAHSSRQVEMLTAAMRQQQTLKDPIFVNIDGTEYIKVDAIHTTSTCPVPGGYDLLTPGIASVISLALIFGRVGVVVKQCQVPLS